MRCNKANDLWRGHLTVPISCVGQDKYKPHKCEHQRKHYEKKVHDPSRTSTLETGRGRVQAGLNKRIEEAGKEGQGLKEHCCRGWL
jgi:hypothetical protein